MDMSPETILWTRIRFVRLFKRFWNRGPLDQVLLLIIGTGTLCGSMILDGIGPDRDEIKVLSTNWLVPRASVSIYTVNLWINVVIDDFSLLNLAFIWLIRVKYRDYLPFRYWNRDLFRLQLLILGSIRLTIRKIGRIIFSKIFTLWSSLNFSNRRKFWCEIRQNEVKMGLKWGQSFNREKPISFICTKIIIVIVRSMILHLFDCTNRFNFLRQ